MNRIELNALQICTELFSVLNSVELRKKQFSIFFSYRDYHQKLKLSLYRKNEEWHIEALYKTSDFIDTKENENQVTNMQFHALINTIAEDIFANHVSEVKILAEGNAYFYSDSAKFGLKIA